MKISSLAIVSFLMLFSTTTYACDYPSVEKNSEISYVEEINENGIKLYNIKVVLPLKIDGWALSQVRYHQGNDLIRLSGSNSYKLRGPSEYSIFYLTLGVESATNSHLSIIYRPPGTSPMEHPVCLLVEELEYGI